MGVDLRVDGAVPEVVAAIEAGLGRYPAHLGVGGSLDVTVSVHPDEPGDPAWPRVTAADGPDDLRVRCGSAVCTLVYTTGAVSLALPASLLQVPDAVRLMVESVFTAASVRAQRLFAVHSALVQHRGVGVLLRGASGAGKSTLTYACLRTGMGVCSDDWLYAPAAAPVGTFAGYPWRMMMTEDAASRFAELTTTPTVPHPAAEGRKVPVHPPAHQQVVAAVADAVVVLDPSPTLLLRRIDLDEAVERFWAPALPTERDTLPTQWVRALLDRPTFVLQRGTDPAATAATLADLAATLAESAVE
jgi:hypothetical protein